MTLPRGWYRFDEWTGFWFWNGLHWHAMMPCQHPRGNPVPTEPPK